MRRILIVGYMHPLCDKRVLFSVEIMKKFGKVYYQYNNTITSENEKCDDVLKNVKKIALGEEAEPLDIGILKLVERIHPDVVYFHDLPYFSVENLPIFLKKKYSDVVVIHDAHEILPDFLYKEEWAKESREKLWGRYIEALKVIDAIIFVNEDMKKYVQEKTRILIERSFILPNLARKALTAPLEKEKTVVLVGGTPRIVSPLFMEIFAKFGYEIKVIGNMEVPNITRIERLKYTKLPKLPYFEMLEEIGKAMFVFISVNFPFPFYDFYPSYKYSTPNKLYDSLAAYTPVITTYLFPTMSHFLQEYGIGVSIKSDIELERFLESVESDSGIYVELINSIERKKQDFYWNDSWKRKFEKFLGEVL